MSNSSPKFFSLENNNKTHIGASVKRDNEVQFPEFLFIIFTNINCKD